MWAGEYSLGMEDVDLEKGDSEISVTLLISNCKKKWEKQNDIIITDYVARRLGVSSVNETGAL